MASRIIEVAATLDSTHRKADRSVSLKFTTMKETTSEEFTVMDSYHQSSGFLLFKESKFKEEEIPKEDVEVDIEKSQSTQIRDALWILYKTLGNNPAEKEQWNRFYKEKCQAFKARILEEVHRLED